MRGCGVFRSLNVDLSNPYEAWIICRIRQAEPWFTLMSQAEILRELGLERTVMERHLKGLKEDMRYGLWYTTYVRRVLWCLENVENIV